MIIYYRFLLSISLKHLQKNSVADGGFLTLMKNKKLQTILKTPFKSLPSIQNEKSKNSLMAGSEGLNTFIPADNSLFVR